MQEYGLQTEVSTDFRQRIRGIVSKIARIDPNELDDGVKIREELGVDSLMAMEIIATCEKRLQLHIDENDVVKIETVGEFIDLLVDLHRSQHA